MLALSFHAIFEGLAVGLEEEQHDVWTLFAGKDFFFQLSKQEFFKVVCNEKHGGGGRHTFALGLRPWRSRFVCRLILLSSFVSINISVSAK